MFLSINTADYAAQGMENQSPKHCTPLSQQVRANVAIHYFSSADTA